MRRRVPWWVLVLGFVGLPLLEIYVLIQVGQVIGAWWTIGLLLADGLLGGYLIKHEGLHAWRALQEALTAHRMPARELADAALVLVGGTLLLTPGFVTDAVGFFCVFPLTRPLARRALTAFVVRRFAGGGTRGSGSRTTRGAGQARQSPGPDDVVRGEVVD